MEYRFARLKRNRQPLVITEAIPGEIAPAVARVHYERILRALHHDKEPVLRHVTEVVLRPFKHELFAVRAQDVCCRYAICLRSIPTVQIRRAEIVDTVLLEHGVSFAAARATLVDIHRLGTVNSQEIRFPERRHVQVSTAFHVRSNYVRFAVIILEERLVAGIVVHKKRHLAFGLHACKLEWPRRGIAGGKILAEFHARACALAREHILLALRVVHDANAPEPSTARFARLQHDSLEFPVDQILRGIAGDARKSGIVVFLGGVRRVCNGTVVLDTVPVERIAHLEHATALRIDKVAVRIFPETVIYDSLRRSHSGKGCNKQSPGKHRLE